MSLSPASAFALASALAMPSLTKVKTGPMASLGAHALRAPGQYRERCPVGPCIGYLGHPFQKQALRDGERSTFPACKQRRVGVQSEVVTSILMLERHYPHVMEKLV